MATFATIQCKLVTTTTELSILVAKKFFISDLSKYHLCVIKGRSGEWKIHFPFEFLKIDCL